MSRVTLIGFGTIGRVVADLFIERSELELDAIVVSEGFEDTVPKSMGKFLIPWNEFVEGKKRNYFVCIGYQDLNTKREKFHNLAREAGHFPLTLVHKYAFVSQSANLGEGSLVMPGVTIENNTRVGHGTFLWSGTVVGHESNVGCFSFISANTSIGGSAKIGNNCVVGLGVNIGNRVSVGDRCVIGAGVLTTRHVLEDSVLVRSSENPLGWPSQEFLKLTDFDAFNSSKTTND